MCINSIHCDYSVIWVCKTKSHFIDSSWICRTDSVFRKKNVVAYRSIVMSNSKEASKTRINVKEMQRSVNLRRSSEVLWDHSNLIPWSSFNNKVKGFVIRTWRFFGYEMKIGIWIIKKKSLRGVPMNPASARSNSKQFVWFSPNNASFSVLLL